ncbi:hypothetical protein D3C74_339530 [compost metagenome]
MQHIVGLHLADQMTHLLFIIQITDMDLGTYSKRMYIRSPDYRRNHCTNFSKIRYSMSPGKTGSACN